MAWAVAPQESAEELAAFLAGTCPAFYLVPDLLICTSGCRSPETRWTATGWRLSGRSGWSRNGLPGPDVADMGAASDALMKLRPVTFHYRAKYDDGQRLLQYGLIAEEVAEVDPGLVEYDGDGKPLTVRYHFVNAMLLGEVQKQHATIAAQAARIAQQDADIAGQRSVSSTVTPRSWRGIV